ncbi:MAG: hypothetical protein NWT08_10705 [Akkermansiaceae bacterium]|jgi:hypothetical protein|nr:hypothetical protein [Akkermansiaceae bacterium]MDP4647266.1 hypothetical protein [Akkermansiaceae bacterium]MDP4722508.1 hypothetical protein [Akkermansiaceae bacterium]MDP4781046.1 hypothetical protein [Akkermansiaceae bacterium]MDP4848520.1 hypothetical protein [Akkermansiaceae bacterium]
MKAHSTIFLITLLGGMSFAADEAEDVRSVLEQHAEGSEKLADEQDELSADVQQLVIEQTIPEVIALLDQVEGIMDETTDYLADTDTGGETIAAQTEIIELIHAAAKAKQQQGESGEEGSAMMDMMERMMGKKEGEGDQPGKKPGDKAGQGMTGDSNAENSGEDGASGGKVEERTVPKAAGNAGKSLPNEFQKALDAYNRGLEEQSK